MASNFRTDITAFIDETLSPAARSIALANTARTELRKVLATQTSKRYTTYVDGKRDDNENDVIGTGGGVILYKFSFISDAVAFALAFLRTRVPRVTGKLSESFWVSVNDVYLGNAVNFAGIPADATVVIGNSAAYWRKADVNIKGGKTLKYRTPGELNDCVRALNGQFGRGILSAVRLNDYGFPGKYTPIRSPKRAPYIYQSPVIVLKAVQ